MLASMMGATGHLCDIVMTLHRIACHPGTGAKVYRGPISWKPQASERPAQRGRAAPIALSIMRQSAAIRPAHASRPTEKPLLLVAVCVPREHEDGGAADQWPHAQKRQPGGQDRSSGGLRAGARADGVGSPSLAG